MAAPAAAGTAAAGPVLRAATEGVPGQYIVTLKDQAGVRSLTADLNVTPRHVYTTALHGFSASRSADHLTALRHSPSVARIEQNAKVHTDGTQSGATWGIDRIDQPTPPLSGTYSWNADGTGATAYIIDTGLDADHPTSPAAARTSSTPWAATVRTATATAPTSPAPSAARPGGWPRTWPCAACACSTAVAAARGSRSSPAWTSWPRTTPRRPWRTCPSAAGNSSSDACSFSPASAANVTTVAASDSGDNHAFFSNFGSCVEVYAPGVDATSSWMGGGTNTISGTSMATPHVVGIGALYKSSQGDVPSATLNGWIQAAASPNVINGVPAGTPNLLAQTAGL